MIPPAREYHTLSIVPMPFKSRSIAIFIPARYPVIVGMVVEEIVGIGVYLNPAALVGLI
jgi:hypothetical protein